MRSSKRYGRNAIDGHQRDVSPSRKRTRRRNARSRCPPGLTNYCKRLFASFWKVTTNQDLANIPTAFDLEEDATLLSDKLIAPGLEPPGMWREIYEPASIAWII